MATEKDNTSIKDKVAEKLAQKKMKEETPPESPKPDAPKADSVKQVSQTPVLKEKLCKIVPNKTFKTHIGGQDYAFEKGVVIEVNENVKQVLDEAGRIGKEIL